MPNILKCSILVGMNPVDDLKFLHALNSIPGVGAATLRVLKKHFGTWHAAWSASEADLNSALGDKKTVTSILWKRPSMHPDKEMEKLVKENIWIITEEDPVYPSLLKEIPNPPVILYGKGNPHLFTEGKIFLGVVGTRKCTQYGLEAVESLTYELSRAGLTIISGLAAGIDSRAHEAALEAEGKTVAVLGSGVDNFSIFPPENKGLARRITEKGGTVISEYAPGTPALREHFPQRNRIISGLSKGILVVEAPEKSGALITARLALEQNREIFAVPGPIFSIYSRGCHKLIQEGAKLILQAEDILEEFKIEYTKEKRQLAVENDIEKKILEILQEALSVDLIKLRTGLDTSSIITTLSMLELKGQIKNIGGDTWQKI